jgi:phosphorylcholine metabolism protein LicD
MDAKIQFKKESIKIDQLLEMRDTLASFKIPCMLAYGNCLGAVRDKKFILTDGDIDLMVMHENIQNKRADVIEVFESLGYRRIIRDNWNSITNNFFIYMLKKGGIEADIYSYPLYKHWRWEYAYWADKFMLYPKEIFENPRKIMFYGHEFYVPNPPEEYLRICYGNDWRIPWQEQGPSSYEGYKVRFVDMLPSGGKFDPKLDLPIREYIECLKCQDR